MKGGLEGGEGGVVYHLDEGRWGEGGGRGSAGEDGDGEEVCGEKFGEDVLADGAGGLWGGQQSLQP